MWGRGGRTAELLTAKIFPSIKASKPYIVEDVVKAPLHRSARHAISETMAAETKTGASQKKHRAATTESRTLKRKRDVEDLEKLQAAVNELVGRP
jgi:hypothetical protein